MYKTLVYTLLNGNIEELAKITKGDIIQQHIGKQSMCC